MSTDDVTDQLIDFEKADVISPMIYPARPTLLVSGQKPWANMEVTLRPLTYVRTPEYWGIEVIGSMPMIGQPAIVPYAVQLELGSTVGTMALVNGSSMVEPLGGAISMMSPAPKLWIAATRPSGSPAAVTAASPIRSAW